MALFTKPAAQIFAGHNIDSAPRDVLNGEVQTWGTELETLVNAFATTGGVIFASKSAMDATLTYAANTPALVIGDATPANNGLYRKTGSSGSGSWVRVADVPGYSFVRATNAGAGTANAIVATTAIPVNESQLIALPITVTNTATPVTVAFNGGSALTIKTNSGNNPAIGGLTINTVLAGYISGSTFRLLSDQASAAIQAAAEAALAYAEEWATKAEDSLISVEAGGDGSTDYSARHWAAKANASVASVVNRRFNYLADAEAATINASADFVQIEARTEALGAGTGGIYTRHDSDPGHAWSFESADGAFWAISGKMVTPEAGGFTDLYAAVVAAAAANYREVYLDLRPRQTTSVAFPRNTADGSPLTITGPGFGLVTKLNSSGSDYGNDSEHVVGQWRDDNMWRSPIRRAHMGKGAIEHSRTTPLSTTLMRSTAQAIANDTVTQLVTEDYRDRAGGYFSGGPSSFWCGVGGFRRIAVHGNVHFQGNSTGARQVMLYKNGSVVETLGVQPASIGETTITFYFEVDVVDGDYLGVYVYQTSGGSLNISKATSKYEVVEQHMRATVGNRGLIFQGSFTAQETRFGGFQQMVNHIAANYDCLIFSFISSFNDDFNYAFQTPLKMWYNTEGAWTNSIVINESDADWSNSLSVSVGDKIRDTADSTVWIALSAHTTPGSGTFAADRAAEPARWLRYRERWHDTVSNTLWIAEVEYTTPGSGTFSDDRTATPGRWAQAGIGDFPQIQAGGYPRMRRLIRGIRAIKPEFEFFGYVTAAADAPYWDSGGNPRAEYDGSRGYNNVLAFIGQWVESGLEIDGIFFDHFGPPFINTTVRNTVTGYLRDKGLRGAFNCLSPGSAAVLFATEGQKTQAGDIIVFEGYYRDNGDDVLSATNTMISVLAKHAGRDVRLYAGIEGRGVSAGATYAAAGTACTITTIDAHKLSVGNKFYVDGLTGELPDGVYTATSVTEFAIAFTAGVSMSSHNGTCTVYPNRISPYQMDPTALDFLNGKSLFDAYDRPGDIYGWSTIQYDTM